MDKGNAPKPQKRHQALVPLSHDHHQGLLLCWKIRMGFSKGIEPKRISDYVRHFFDLHLKRHFAEEENVLLSRLDEKDDKRKETELQHRNLYNLRDKLDSEDTELEDCLYDFERQLETHIRFEERELFPYLQEVFDEENLKDIQSQLEKEEPFREEWEDIFWKK